VFTAETLRYAMACLILLLLARLTGRRLMMPRGTEWLWLYGIAASGLVLFNVALVAGSRHAEPAVLGVAWAVVVLGCEAAFTLLAIPVLGRCGMETVMAVTV
jgi:drug/metabolite transporter (DMT)-like permease